MILRNLRPPVMTNEIRCLITGLANNYIEFKIYTGKYKDKIVILPRIKFSDENTLTFSFTKLQFPVKLCFAMTINKSQGQTFKKVGIDISTPVFTHVQLYISLS